MLHGDFYFLYIYFFFFLFRFFSIIVLKDIDYSSLCYTVGPCWLSILYIIVCSYQSQTPNLSLSFPLSVQFSCSVMSHTLRPHGLQASLPITNSQSLLKLMSIVSVMPSNDLVLCHPLLLPSSIFPSIRVFSN